MHSDLINRNVLVSSGRLTAVFDWGCGRYGDFLYDVAWLEFWAPWFEAIDEAELRTGLLRHYESIGLDILDFDARVRACMIHIGLSHQAYHAYTGLQADLESVTARLLPLLD